MTAEILSPVQQTRRFFLAMLVVVLFSSTTRAEPTHIVSGFNPQENFFSLFFLPEFEVYDLDPAAGEFSNPQTYLARGPASFSAMDRHPDGTLFAIQQDSLVRVNEETGEGTTVVRLSSPDFEFDLFSQCASMAWLPGGQPKLYVICAPTEFFYLLAEEEELGPFEFPFPRPAIPHLAEVNLETGELTRVDIAIGGALSPFHGIDYSPAHGLLHCFGENFFPFELDEEEAFPGPRIPLEQTGLEVINLDTESVDPVQPGDGPVLLEEFPAYFTGVTFLDGVLVLIDSYVEEEQNQEVINGFRFPFLPGDNRDADNEITVLGLADSNEGLTYVAFEQGYFTSEGAMNCLGGIPGDEEEEEEGVLISEAGSVLVELQRFEDDTESFVRIRGGQYGVLYGVDLTSVVYSVFFEKLLIDPLTGALYGFTYNLGQPFSVLSGPIGGFESEGLIRLDRAAGPTVEVTGYDIEFDLEEEDIDELASVAFDSSGRLWGITLSGELIEIDRATGALLRSVQLDLHSLSLAEQIEFNPSDGYFYVFGGELGRESSETSDFILADDMGNTFARAHDEPSSSNIDFLIDIAIETGESFLASVILRPGEEREESPLPDFQSALYTVSTSGEFSELNSDLGGFFIIALRKKTNDGDFTTVPDVSVGNSKGRLIGNNIYNRNGSRQTIRQTGKVQRLKGSFFAKVENDGGVTGPIAIRSVGGKRSDNVRYLNNGRNITALVKRGRALTIRAKRSEPILVKYSRKRGPSFKTRFRITATAGNRADQAGARISIDRIQPPGYKPQEL